MQTRFLALGLLLAAGTAHAQGVRIGAAGLPNPAAVLDLSAAGKGLLIPRMDSATRAAIPNPPDGLMVFQTSHRHGFWYCFSGIWIFLPDKARAGDNLGNHTATQNLNLGANTLTGGGISGLRLDNAGNVGVGTAPSAGARLDVVGTTRSTAVEGTSLKVTGGAATGKVLTSDAAGNATWQSAPVPPPATTTSYQDQTLLYSTNGF